MSTTKHALPPKLLQLARENAASDAELLTRFVASNDEAAFGSLVERHGPMVLGVCRRVLGNLHDAEDAFQATFLALMRSAKRVNSPGSIAAWLYGAAVRVSLKARCNAARSRTNFNRPSIRSTHDPLAEISGRELVRAIDEELLCLPERFRVAVLLCCLEGLSQEEAARSLGWSIGSVKGRLERGREKLRVRLGKRGIVLSVGFGSLILGEARATVPPRLFARVLELTADKVAPQALTRLAANAVPSSSKPKVIAIALVVIASGSLIAAGRGDPPPVQAPQPHPAGVPTRAAATTDKFGDPLPPGAILRLGTTRLRQAHPYAIAFTSESTLASFGEDYVLHKWDVLSGKSIGSREFEKGGTGQPQIGAWLSAGGKKLAVHLNDRVKVFDSQTGKELAAVVIGDLFPVSARFSPDGKLIAVVSQETGALQLCDIGKNSTRKLDRFRPSSSGDLAFSRDGQRLALARPGAGIHVWDVVSGQRLMRVPPDFFPLSVDLNNAGDVLAVLGAGPNQTIRYFEVPGAVSPVGWMTPPTGELHWVRFAPDGSSLLLGGKEGVKWFDPKSGKTTLTANGIAELPPAISADGRLMASASWNTLQVWEAANGRSIVSKNISEAPAEEVQGVAISLDGKFFLTNDGESGTIRVWDSSAQQVSTVRSRASNGGNPCVSPDGQFLYGPAQDAVALVRWDLRTGAETMRYSLTEEVQQHFIYNFALSADGRRLAACSQSAGEGHMNRSATLTVWDASTGKREDSRILTQSPNWIGYGGFSPDVRWYASGDRVFSLAGRRDIMLDMPQGWTWHRATISPDGRWIAQGVDEQTQRVVNGKPWYDVEPRGVVVHETVTGKRVLTLPTGFSGPLRFTPDGRGLVVTNPETITRWDLPSQKPVVSHAAPGSFNGSYGRSFASNLALNRDGTRALTGHIDTSALVWDIAPPARKSHALSEKEFETAWVDLASADAGRAFSAIWTMADSGEEAVKFLRTRLTPVVAPKEEPMRKLFAQLGAEEFADRERAEKELREMGDAAIPALRALLKTEPSAEQAIRGEAILKAAAPLTLSPGSYLRRVRAIAVLEQIGSKDARELLTLLAGGVAEARLTREAKGAIEHLQLLAR